MTQETVTVVFYILHKDEIPLLRSLSKLKTDKTVMKFRQIVKIIQENGWYYERTKGSHKQYKHPTKPGVVTIAGKPGEEVPKGTLNNILKQADLKN